VPSSQKKTVALIEKQGPGQPRANLRTVETIVGFRTNRPVENTSVTSYAIRALRARAEFANYQKRAKQQAEAERAYAVGSLAKDLLDPLDNLDRAIEAFARQGLLKAITSGLEHGPEATSRNHGQARRPAHIRARATRLTLTLHDAILQQPSLEHPEGTVVAELSKGYNHRRPRSAAQQGRCVRQADPKGRVKECLPTITSATLAATSLRRTNQSRQSH